MSELDNSDLYEGRMRMVSVKSSNIKQIGFEENKQVSLGRKVNVLRIIFLTGMIYDYYNVPKVTYTKFLKAKSIGTYFWEHIKDKYQFEKVK